jgi:hypothetical protein
VYGAVSVHGRAGVAAVSDDTKTHYRKAFDSPYLSSSDIVDATALTIECVTLEKDRTKKTQDLFNTAWFCERELRPGEKLKPMILNATNSKFLAHLTGSKWIDDWQNVSVTVYVDGAVRFGRETVEGLRLMRQAEQPAKPKGPKPISEERFAAALASLKKGGVTADFIKTRFVLTDKQSDTLALEVDAMRAPETTE